MRIVVTGSIATDHLMTFGGKFTDSIVEGQLEKLSVSFLVNDLNIHRGGVAGNIAFGLGCLGEQPVLVGAVGEDFADYDAWLTRHGVDTESVHVVEDLHTARFICTTDEVGNQISSFYPGAMSRSRDIELEPVIQRIGGADLVVISPDDPEAMTRHTEQCRQLGVAFAADPSQQLTSMEPDRVRDLIEGADYLFTNEYEASLVERRTGWSQQEIDDKVRVRVTTLADKGSRIVAEGGEPIEVEAAPITSLVDPTGVGDAFRSGFLAGVGWGLPWRECAEVGSVVAAFVIETTGTQEHSVNPDVMLDRLREVYGDESAGVVAAAIASATT